MREKESGTEHKRERERHGFNQYLYYLNQQKPNWHKLLKNKNGKQYSIIVLDN